MSDDPGARPTSPRERIRTETERVVRRWHELPLDHALAHVPTLLAALQPLADAAGPSDDVASVEAGAPRVLPDLGPAVVPDQLRVVVHDALESAEDDAAAQRVADALTALRRALP